MSIPEYIQLIPNGQQDARILPVWRSFFEQHQFSQVIEMGTWEGGFITQVKAMIPGVPIWTWDIVDRWSVEPATPPMLRVIGDVVVYERLIGDLIHRQKTLVMVDTGMGDKPRDFAAFAKYLTPGDAIGIHDYFDTQEDFNTPETWHCWETRLDMIEESLVGLSRVMKDEFRVGGWGVWTRD